MLNNDPVNKRNDALHLFVCVCEREIWQQSIIIEKGFGKISVSSRLK